jgi:hypothetical protein
MSNIDMDSVNKLLFSKKSSNRATIDAFKELKPTKKNILIYLIFIIFSIFIAVLVSFSDDTIPLLSDNIELLNGTILAVFAIVFSGYVFFQALVSRNVLLRFLEKNKSGTTYLQITNEYFLNIMLLYILCIIVNLIFLLILKNISPDTSLPLPNIINEILASLFLTGYYFYHLILIYETKSFIFNIYRVLNINAVEQAAEMIEDQSKKE